MAMKRASFVVDLAVTVLMGIAAVLFIWRFLSTPNIPSGPEAQAAFNDITSDNITIAVSGETVKGTPSARVVLIEFSDFECPYCARYADQTADQVNRDYVQTGKIKYAFRHFPLERVHPHAMSAAYAAHCAGVQGRFWDMHSRLFARQKELSEAIWIQESTALRLDESAFRACMGGQVERIIRADISEGTRLGVKSTPTFFVGVLESNGIARLQRRINGARPLSVFQESLNVALKSS